MRGDCDEEMIEFELKTDDGPFVIDLRDLHTALESEQQFADFARRGLKDFHEGESYEVFLSAEKNPKGGRPSREYRVTLDVAKHVCMKQRTEKGDQARLYFLRRGRRRRLMPNHQSAR